MCAHQPDGLEGVQLSSLVDLARLTSRVAPSHLSLGGVMLDRRAFLCGSVAMLTAPLAAEAQPSPRIPRIGVVAGGFPQDDGCAEALRRGMADLGYAEGRTHVVEWRWAQGRVELFPSLAADLVRLNVDLIVSAAAPAAEAVKEASKSSVPVVLASSFYPVNSGSSPASGIPGAT
jgi:putative ABC transport system substrate-binding protein